MTDAASWIEQMLINFETHKPFVLTGAERRFLKHAFRINADGGLVYPELVFSAPKKSGKTCFAAMIMIYVVRVLGGPYAEGICCANDEEQAQGRVFQAISRIIEASPLLSADASLTASKIEFISTGATIIAISSDYASAAGANPSITCFDELWGYRSERAHRLWDELVPPPTRKIACRLTVTYAGFEGESNLLEALYKRALSGEQVEPDLYAQPGMLAFWTNKFTAPWQTPTWREQMRATLRPKAFLRFIENLWVTSESSFIDMDLFDRCVDPNHRPLLGEGRRGSRHRDIARRAPRLKEARWPAGIVPTIGFRLLYALVILRHDRRRIVSFGVTAHPTAEWIARQITEAFSWNDVPRYLIRDRDTAYGHDVTRRLRMMGTLDRPTAPRSPWQNGCVERLIGSIRRECIDHVVAFDETHLRRLLNAYMAYYNEARTHLSLGKDAPNHRPFE